MKKYVSLVIIFFICCTLFSACEAKPKIVSACMTNGIESSTYKNIDEVEGYPPDVDYAMASVQVQNFKPGMVIKFEWMYEDQEEAIDTVEIEYEEDDGEYIMGMLTLGYTPWPEGNYKVNIYIENEKKPSYTINFEMSQIYTNVTPVTE